IRKKYREKYEIGSSSGYTYVMDPDNKAVLNPFDLEALLKGNNTGSGSSYVPKTTTRIVDILRQTNREGIFNPSSGQLVYASGRERQVRTPSPAYMKETDNVRGTGNGTLSPQGTGNGQTSSKSIINTVTDFFDPSTNSI